MTSKPRITDRPHPGIGAEDARDIRARAWAFVFDCHARKAAAGANGNRDDTKEGPLDDFRAETSLPW